MPFPFHNITFNIIVLLGKYIYCSLLLFKREASKDRNVLLSYVQVNKCKFNTNRNLLNESVYSSNFALLRLKDFILLEEALVCKFEKPVTRNQHYL